MGVSDLEAVCRSEAQRVLTSLRGNRKFGSLHRSWREFEEGTPIRQLSEWRNDDEAAPAALLRPLLQIVRSPEFSGPTTYAALEAAQAVVLALCEAPEAAPSEQGLAGVLVEVSGAVCECVFEETNAQVDEATTMQMITVLGLCATLPASADLAAFPSSARMQVFAKVLALWGHYRHSPALRACAQAALQRMLDFACSDLPVQAEFVGAVLQRISTEVGPSLSADWVLLYLRCLQRLMTHPAARRWSVADGPVASFFQDSVPLALLSIGDHFSTSISVLSLLLPIVNRTCWLCVDHWAADAGGGGQDGAPAEGRRTSCLGALQVESLMGSIYLRSLKRAVAPLQCTEGEAGGLTAKEGEELLVVLLEGLCDLLRADTVRTLWISFDADWRRPPLLEQVVECIVVLFHDAPSTERPLPAHIVHLISTVLARIVAAFAAVGAEACQDEAELAEVKEQWRKREAILQFIEKFEESPKKARQALDKSGILDFVPLPPHLPGCTQDPPFQDWARKLAWILRCLNHCVPYEAMGELFGQPPGKTEVKDTTIASGAFVDTFNWGPADIDEALRSFLQAFLLPKEGQQIDRVLETFATFYYRKHIEHAEVNKIPNSTYLKHVDAAHTLAFSIIMVNTDQHNPKVKKRMNLNQFLTNNRGINAGENIPEEVQARIFDSIRLNEIKTPSSGSLAEGVSPARWVDFKQLIRQGYRDNALAGLRPDLHGRSLGAHAQVFLERMGEKLRTTLEHALASDSGAHSDALEGLEQLLRLTLQCRRPEADGVAEALFFFGSEVFHEPQPRAPVGRAAACLRVLFRTALARLTNMSTKQLHMMVYLTAQFALYGLFERALPPSDPITAKLLRAPSLVVDPPTGVVYSFLRKISTAPFKMLSYAEEGSNDDRKSRGPDGSPPRSGTVAGSPSGGAPSGSPRSSQGEDAEGAVAGQEPVAASPPASTSQASADASPPATEETGRGEDGSGKAPLNSPPPEAVAADEASLHDDPLRPQIEQAFEACDLDAFVRTLVQLWQPCGDAQFQASPQEDGGRGEPSAEALEPGSAQTILGYLSSLFLALRSGGPGKVGNNQDLPWWPEPPAFTCMATPQALQLPKRALSLNVLDGYETLRLALRLMTATLGAQAAANARQDPGAPVPSPVWESTAVQELSVCAHIGLFHTLRRGDLCERTLRVAIAGFFQAGATLLTTRSAEGPVVSLGWPVRLISELLRRTEGEPQLLVPTARLCLEAVRAFVAEVSRVRPMDRLELWKALLLLLLKAAPTPARALWPGTKDREVEVIQGQLWRQGAVWLLGHPQLLVCAEGGPSAPAGSAGAGERGASGEGGGFWSWALGELAALAQEMAAGSRPAVTRLLLEAYGTLLGSIARVQDAEEYAAQDDDSAEQPPAVSSAASFALARPAAQEAAAGASPYASGGANSSTEYIAANERSAAWSRVAIALLTYIGPSLGKPNIEDSELQPVPLLKQAMLNVRVPPLLSASAQGPYWARLALEKLVSSLTGAVSSGAPLSVVREAVSLVAKFFLQNLHTLQRHECFGQLWLMVLRLMLLFIKRGTDDRDTELEEIATETLKNLLCVLLSTRTLGYVAPKGAAAGAQEEVPVAGGEVKIWWQMTWDCIEVFLPGFGEEFAKSMLPDDAQPPAAAGPVVADLPTASVGVCSPVADGRPPSAEPAPAPAPSEPAAPEAPPPPESPASPPVSEVSAAMLGLQPEASSEELAAAGREEEAAGAGAGEAVEPAPLEPQAAAEEPAAEGVEVREVEVSMQREDALAQQQPEEPQATPRDEPGSSPKEQPLQAMPGAKARRATPPAAPAAKGSDEAGNAAGAELAAVLARRRRAAEAQEAEAEAEKAAANAVEASATAVGGEGSPE